MAFNIDRDVGLSDGELFARIIRDGGITFSLRGRCVRKAGYAVSPFKDRERVFNVLRVQHLKDYIAANRDLLADRDKYLGAWIAPDGCYLDVSIVVSTAEEAAEIARQNGQLAYYILHEGRTVEVQDKRDVWAHVGKHHP